MGTYRVSAETFDIEADTAEQALAIAESRFLAGARATFLVTLEHEDAHGGQLLTVVLERGSGVQ